MTKRVTFLMPVYNGMEYLDEAVSTVLQQPGDDWELWIVDDISRDQTWTHVQQRYGDDPRVKLLRNEQNMGLYGTLNHWVRRVKSEFTSIVFQDDRVQPGYLERLLTVADAHPEVQFYWAAIDIIGPQSEIMHQGVDSGRVDLIRPGGAAWRHVLETGTIWTISGSFSRSVALHRYGFRPDLPHLGDFDLLLRGILEVPFLYLEERLAQFREHAEQASAKNLSSLRDMEERILVVGEQMAARPDLADTRLRLRMCHRLARGLVRRAAGKIRRGQVGGCVQALGLLPGIVRSVFR